MFPFKFSLVLLRHSLAHGTKSLFSETDLVVVLLFPLLSLFTFLYTFLLSSKGNTPFFFFFNLDFFPLQFSSLFDGYCLFHKAYLSASDTEEFFRIRDWLSLPSIQHKNLTFKGVYSLEHF